MYCNWCGKGIDVAAVYCQSCGRAVRAVPSKKLFRPRVGRKVAGVAVAVANYFDLDVTLVRLVWVLVALFGGCGVLAYFVGWLVIPSEPEFVPTGEVQQPQAQAS